MKYFLIGGVVKSKDGDIHVISPSRLMELYRLERKDVLFNLHGYRSDYVVLCPRSEGDYKEYLKMVTDAYIRDLKGLNEPTGDAMWPW